MDEVGIGSSENRNDPLPETSSRGFCALSLRNEIRPGLTIVTLADLCKRKKYADVLYSSKLVLDEQKDGKLDTEGYEGTDNGGEKGLQ